MMEIGKLLVLWLWGKKKFTHFPASSLLLPVLSWLKY